MRSEKYHSYIISTYSGSTVKHTSPDRIKEFGFLLPPLEKQIAAVHILNTIENKINLMENTNAILEKIIMECFKRFFSNLDEHERRPLSEFGKIVCGKTPTKERSYNYFGGPFPFIKISDLKQNCIYVIHTADSLSYEGAAIQKEKQIPADSICVSCIGTIGLVSLTPNICYTNQQINTVIPHHDYQRYYLYCYLKMMRSQLEELSTGGSILLNLNKAGFSRLPIPGPPQSQLKIFYGFVHSIFKRIYLNSYYIDSLIMARDLYQKAFSLSLKNVML
jgi:type I restriction enzyme S subunit